LEKRYPRQKDGWSAQLDPRTGRFYYINHATRKTQWEMPTTSAVNQQTSQALNELSDRARKEREERAAEAKRLQDEVGWLQ